MCVYIKICMRTRIGQRTPLALIAPSSIKLNQIASLKSHLELPNSFRESLIATQRAILVRIGVYP